LDQVESQATGHLVALGVLPGAELTLVQRFPAFVVRMGNAEFAVDRELAGRVYVRAP
jgi:Fe2+ transport system protein FeoA